jgi:hypothetical protein
MDGDFLDFGDRKSAVAKALERVGIRTGGFTRHD